MMHPPLSLLRLEKIVGETSLRFVLKPNLPLEIRPFLGRCLFLISPFLLAVVIAAAASEPGYSFRERLKETPFKIAYETYVDNNWEIFVMNPDGSNPVNLTKTPNEHEHYPQVSPDGSKLCYSIDEGEGRDAIRSLYLMDID